jgi:hypothetical protein
MFSIRATAPMRRKAGSAAMDAGFGSDGSRTPDLVKDLGW